MAEGVFFTKINLSSLGQFEKGGPGTRDMLGAGFLLVVPASSIVPPIG